MTRILNKIAKPEDDVQKINENFDRISLDLADRSGVFSSVGTIPTGLTVPNNEGRYIEVNILDNQNIYLSGSLPVIVRTDIFINNDGNYSYFWPAGGNLTAAQLGSISIETFTARTVINQATNEKATVFIHFRNNSGSTIVFYANIQAYYVPAPDLGVARRSQ